MEMQSEVASNQYEFVAATGAKPDRHIVIKLKQKHLRLASLAVAAVTGAIMSLEIQGMFDLQEPAWFCLNAVFALALWYPMQRSKK
jgi:hypothetical protein